MLTEACPKNRPPGLARMCAVSKPNLPLANVGRFGPTFGPNPAKLGQISADLGQTWSNMVEIRAKLGNSAQIQSESV